MNNDNAFCQIENTTGLAIDAGRGSLRPAEATRAAIVGDAITFTGALDDATPVEVMSGGAEAEGSTVTFSAPGPCMLRVRNAHGQLCASHWLVYEVAALTLLPRSNRASDKHTNWTERLKRAVLSMHAGDASGAQSGLCQDLRGCRVWNQVG